MALKFIDGFDDRTTANILAGKWTTGGAGTIGSAYGRNGYGCLIGGGAQNLRKTVGATQEWYVGFAFRHPTGSSQSVGIFNFSDGGTKQVYFQLNTPAQTWSIYHGNGTILATSTAFYTADIWVYVELGVIIDDVSGFAEIKINGTSVASYSGDTQNTANAYADIFDFYAGSGNFYVDDFYICDGTGSDTYRGDCKVECLRPSGAGNYSQFFPSAGSNYQNVDDAIASVPCPDGDTTYNQSGTVGSIDTFVFEDLATTSGTIHGVQTVINARKTDAGTRTIAPLIRQSSVDYVGTSVNLSSSYIDILEIYELNPATSLAWTITDINTNAEFGYKDVA